MAKHNKKNDQTVPPVQSSADETQQSNIDKLLQTVQLLISQQLQSSKGAQSQSPSHLNVKFDQFNDEDETFTNFVNRFENYYQLTGQLAAWKVGMFLNVLGAKRFQLLSTLCTPAAPTSLTFDEIIQTLKQHLDPIPNIIAQQYKFGQRKQREGESISKFVAALKALSVHAEFKLSLIHISEPTRPY